MAYPLSLTAAAALAVAGIGLGVHLGRDAIAQINPSFYDSATPSTFYASLVPNPPTFEPQGLGAPQHPEAIITDESGRCASCGVGEQFVDFAGGAGNDQADPEWSEPQAAAAVEVETAAFAAVPVDIDPALEQVELYAHYPVRAEDVQVVAVQSYSYAGGE